MDILIIFIYTVLVAANVIWVIVLDRYRDLIAEYRTEIEHLKAEAENADKCGGR